MSKPYTHAENSVKLFGGKPEDYLAIHEFMDSSKLAIPDNRHRALTHNSWFVGTVLDRVFGVTIKNSDGKKIPTREIGEQHILDDFDNGFIPSAQDFVQFLQPQSWMSNEGGFPPSRENVCAPFGGLHKKSPEVLVGHGYRLAIDGNTQRAVLVPYLGSIYDTEFCVAGVECKFFVRPISQTFAVDSAQKTLQDTNMNQSTMLDYPRKFDMRGLAFFMEKGFSDIAGFANISFDFCGGRKLSYSLSSFIDFDIENARKTLPKTVVRSNNRPLPDNALDASQIHSLDANDWLTIEPGHAFFATLSWADNLPALLKGTRFTAIAALCGMLYQPE